jgi:hypothetical protein
LIASVMDSAGNALSTSQSGSQFQVAINPTYAGRHYLLLRYYSTSSTYQGPYSLTLRGYDSSQSSFPVKFNAPDSTTTWAAGSSYSIDVDAAGDDAVALAALDVGEEADAAGIVLEGGVVAALGRRQAWPAPGSGQAGRREAVGARARVSP